MAFLSDSIWPKLMSEYLIKSTLVLTFAIFLSYLCRKQPASLRHLILSVSLIGLLIFPLLSSIEAGWTTGLLPSWIIETKAPATSDISSFSHRTHPFVLNDNTPLKPQNQGKEFATPPIDTRMSGSILWELLRYGFLIIWLTGLTLILARQIFGLYGAYKLSREAEDLKSSFWRHLLHRFLEAISVKRKVDLLRNAKVKVPLTWGWLKPVVIMPYDSESWTAEQRESALYHELSHVKRGDFLVSMLARISLGLYWFNPLSWMVFQAMKKEQEKACDELVLKTGIKPSVYAANLLSIRRSMQSPWNPPAAVLGALGKSQLNERLLAILKQKFTLKEVKMKTKIFLSALVIITITFLGMARPSSPSKEMILSDIGDISLAEESSLGMHLGQENTEKKDQEKTDKKENKDKKKDVFVWHMDDGKEGEVEVIITDNGKVKSFTIKEPVIIIKKDESGKEIAITSKGKAIDIKKGEKGTWVVKGDAVTLHEHMEAIDLGEGSVVTIKTKTEDGQKTIAIEAPAIVVKKIDDSTKHITLKVSDEGGKKKAVVVAPHVDVTHHPNVHLHIKETELKKIHEKLEKIHERLSKQMESKTEEEEQALKEMEEMLKKMEKKLDAMENKVKDIHLTLHEEPHKVQLKHGHAISIKHKGDEEDIVHIAKDKDYLMSFVDEEGEISLLSHIELEKTHKQALKDAVKEIEKKLPEGFTIECDFDEDSGMATVKVKGHSVSKDTTDDVIALLKGLKKKLDTKN
jgi:beta-lactamase regulating signal transducer with metallopeptidase domain